MWKEVDHIPENWHIVEGAALRIPVGFLLIENGVSRFDPNGGRKTAIIKQEKVMSPITFIGKVTVLVLIILLPLITPAQTPAAKKQAGRFALKTSLIFASGMAEGTRETLKWHYPKFKAVFPGANDSYWNPSLSSNRKYKGGNPANGPAFPGATKALVWTRDGYHLMGMLRNAPMIVGVTIPIGGKPRKWYTYACEAASYYLAYTAGFTLTYDIIF